MKTYYFLDRTSIEVEDNVCRGCYLEKAKADELPIEISAVWWNDTFVVRQDAECPVPGFYILSVREHINTIGDLATEKASEFGIILNRVRIAMKNALGIRRIHMILEERMFEPHLHIWLLPLWESVMEKNDIDPKVWNSNILEYINLFSYEDNKNKIREFNSIMKDVLAKDEILKGIITEEE